MLTKKDYCDYELRLGLRDIGYPMSTCQINDGPIQMPKITLYEAQKWLREEKGMHIEINLQFLPEEKRWYWGFTIIYFDNPDLVTINGDYPSYEETLSEGIKAAVKILKEEDND